MTKIQRDLVVVFKKRRRDLVESYKLHCIGSSNSAVT